MSTTAGQAWWGPAPPTLCRGQQEVCPPGSPGLGPWSGWQAWDTLQEVVPALNPRVGPGSAVFSDSLGESRWCPHFLICKIKYQPRRTLAWPR